jgi:hypothetical protein
VRGLFLLAALLAAGPARASSAEDSALARLGSGDAAARERACLDLARAPRRGPRVYPALALSAERDLSERVRLGAAEALVTFPGDDAVRRARDFLRSEPGPQNRAGLLLALSTAPAHLEDGDVTNTIAGMLFDDPSPRVRLAAALGLSRRGDRRALAQVQRAAENDADKPVRDAARAAARALAAVPLPRAAPARKPSPPKPDAVKGRDPCPAPWGWCECSGPIVRPAKCLERADCRIELDTMLQLGMPCTWNGLSFDAAN